MNLNSKKTVQNTKLIKLLATFSTLEWKRFGRFVQSPYHNTNESIIQLHTILKNAFPFDTLKQLEEERIYKKLYGKEPFDTAKFRNICSDLYKLAEEFTINVYLNKEKRKKEKLLIEALSERNYELFKGASQQLIKEIETQEYFLDEDDFLLLYQLNNELWHHLEKDKFIVEQKELDHSRQYLDAFYENIQTQLKGEREGRNNMVNRKKEKETLTIHQLATLFHKAIELHQTKSVEKYFQLKEEILINWSKLKQRHKTNLLVHLVNFCIINELLIQDYGYEEPFSLYQIGVKENLFLKNGKIRDIEFVNISLMGLGTNSFRWVESFIQRYQIFLKKEVRDYLIPFIKAYQALVQNDYEQTIVLLSKVYPKNNLPYLIRIKILLIRAYFHGVMKNEVDYIEILQSEIDSTKKLLQRNSNIPKIKVDAYSNFISILKKMLALLPRDFNMAQLIEIEKIILQTKPLVLKKWLGDKVVELKNATS